MSQQRRHTHPHGGLAPLPRRSLVSGVIGAASALLTGCGLELGIAQQDPKQIYLAADDHTDYIWTAGESAYRAAFLEMIDWYLDQIDSDERNRIPSQFHSRWNCDGSFWMWVYERSRTPAQFQRLINRIRDGHISVPITALCLVEGAAPLESIIRGMLYAGRIERRHNLPFPLAYAMENQSLAYGLGSVWAGAGAKYSWKGICDCASKVPDAGDREHEIYWWVGPDGSRILMKWNSLLDTNQSIGGYAEARSPAAAIEVVDSKSTFLSRYVYRIIGIFGYGWDDLKTLLTRGQFADIARQASNSLRQVRVSNMVDFFSGFEARYGAITPSQSVSFGNEWELDTAVMAEVSARERRATERLRAAEALAVLAALNRPALLSGRTAARDLAFMNMGLFYEHDWAGAPTEELTQERIIWQRRIAGEIEQYVGSLSADAVAALGDQISASGRSPRFFVFNPLSWARTDIADLPYRGSMPAHVIDLTTGSQVPSQRIAIGGQQLLRIMAPAIPSVGYKVFEVRSGEGQRLSGGAPTASAAGVLENAAYRLTVAGRGAITSLIDKARGNREFVRVIGGRAANDMSADSSGTLVVEQSGPVSATLRAQVTESGQVRRTTRITLYRGLPRIEIENTIGQSFDSTLTWGFGFNLDAPDVHHEEVGAVIRARLINRTTPASGGHYADRNTRYDWLTLNHFADMSGSGGVGVTLSNADCSFFQLGESSVEALDMKTPQIKVLAGGNVNGYAAIKNQGGDTSFLQRFAIQTHGSYTQASAMRFALEHQNPLISGAISGAGVAYPAQQRSFLTLSNPDVLLWALKPAEDGIDSGIIARVWNMRASQSSFDLALPGRPLARAQRATHLETPAGPETLVNGALRASVRPHQIATFLLNLPAAGAGG